MYRGLVEPEKRINLLFDQVRRQYHVIGNLTGAMTKRYICEDCNKSCKYGKKHTRVQTISECIVPHPCIPSRPRIPLTCAPDTL